MNRTQDDVPVRGPVSEGQTPGRTKNGAVPGGKPEAATSETEVRRVGEQSQRAAGPDGPDAREVGDTFKRQPTSGQGEPPKPVDD